MIKIGSNKDYGREYGVEQFTPEDYICLMYFADCLVGNSSSICKESSILGTPAVLIGSRQENRLIGRNILKVPCEEYEIKNAIEYQLKHQRYKPDKVYYRNNTSRKICNQLQKILKD